MRVSVVPSQLSCLYLRTFYTSRLPGVPKSHFQGLEFLCHSRPPLPLRKLVGNPTTAPRANGQGNEQDKVCTRQVSCLLLIFLIIVHQGIRRT